VGIARQIAQHLPGPSERLLGVDHPIDLAQWRQIGLESSVVGEVGMITEELQAAGMVGRDQHLQKQPAEQCRENLHGQKIAWPACDPLRSVRRQAATGHDHMHMRVMRQKMSYRQLQEQTP
jgi:hypothetical protein